MNSASGLSAGFVLIVVVGIVAGVGGLIGEVAGSVVAGAFTGGILGVFAGFWTVYKLFLVPMRRASMARDYSHITPLTDDDDD